VELNMKSWNTRRLPHSDIAVGPCAWAFTLAVSEHARFVLGHPSLIVIGPDDLAAAPPLSHDAREAIERLPLALHIHEPEFIRRMPAMIEKSLTELRRTRVDAVILHVQEPADIKSGSAIQTLSVLREQGKIGVIGLSATTALEAEWFAGASSARLLSVPFGIEDQSLRFRALAAMSEYSMDALAANAITNDGAAGATAAARFALAMSLQVLPVFAMPLSEEMTAMSAPEAEAEWTQYTASHAPPPALPRSRPPE
jgi:hypothetical protein